MRYAIYNPNNAELLVRFMCKFVDLGYSDSLNSMYSNPNLPLLTEDEKLLDVARAEGREVYYAWIYIYPPHKRVYYMNHERYGVNKRINLTEENFDEVLKEVLQ